MTNNGNEWWPAYVTMATTMAGAAVAEVQMPDRGGPAPQRHLEAVEANRSRGGRWKTAPITIAFANRGRDRAEHVEEHAEPPPAHDSSAEQHVDTLTQLVTCDRWQSLRSLAQGERYLPHGFICRHVIPMKIPMTPATGAPPTEADPNPASSDDDDDDAIMMMMMPPSQGAEAAAAAASAYTSESAAAAWDEPAVAACDAPVVYDVAYFRRQRGLLTRPYNQHNQAMRWLRRQTALPNYEMHGIHFPPPGTMSAFVPAIIHPERTQYSWDHTQGYMWQWVDMVAQLDDDSMEKLVLGVDRRSRGLITCILFENALIDPLRASAGYPYWREYSFVFVRDDGSYGSVVPKWSSTSAGYCSGPPGSWRPSTKPTSPGRCGAMPPTMRPDWIFCGQQSHNKEALRFDANLKWACRTQMGVECYHRSRGLLSPRSLWSTQVGVECYHRSRG